MLEIVLILATLLGGIAAVWYFFDQFTSNDKYVPPHSSTVIELAWHLSMLSWASEVAENTFKEYAEEALNRVNQKLRTLNLKELESSVNHFELVTSEISHLSKELRASFFIGNILGRCQFYGINLVAAGIIPFDEPTNKRTLERLSEAKSRLDDACLPKTLLDGFDSYWREVISGRNLEKYSGNLNDIERERVFSELISSLNNR